MSRRIRCAPLLALALLPPAAIAVARPAPAGPATRVPQLVAEQATVQPGQTLTLRGSGFPGNVHLALLAGPPGGASRRIGGAVTGRAGSFTATIHVRPNASAARFVALACHDACRLKASASFRVVAR